MICRMRFKIICLTLLFSFMFVGSYSPEESVIQQITEIEKLETNSGVTRRFGEEPPSSYLLNIYGYSEIKSNPSAYKSSIFDAVGFKWSLNFYPNGNVKDGGKDHISLYVRIEDTNSLPNNWEVNVYLKVFVTNLARKQFLTIEDGAKRRYNATNREWGYAQVIPLSTFTNESSGFLIKDNICGFGVEIIVLGPPEKTEILLLRQDPPHNNFTWKIPNFSERNQSRYYFSEEFLVGERYWKMAFNPKTGRDERHKTQAIFVLAMGYKPNATVASTYAKIKLRLRNQRGLRDLERNYERFHKTITGFGFGAFFSLQDIYNESFGFNVNDTIIFDVEMLCVSETMVLPTINDEGLSNYLWALNPFKYPKSLLW